MFLEQYLNLGEHLPVLSLAQVFSEDRQMFSFRSGCPRAPGSPHLFTHHCFSGATDLPAAQLLWKHPHIPQANSARLLQHCEPVLWALQLILPLKQVSDPRYHSTGSGGDILSHLDRLVCKTALGCGWIPPKRICILSDQDLQQSFGCPHRREMWMLLERHSFYSRWDKCRYMWRVSLFPPAAWQKMPNTDKYWYFRQTGLSHHTSSKAQLFHKSCIVSQAHMGALGTTEPLRSNQI